MSIRDELLSAIIEFLDVAFFFENYKVFDAPGCTSVEWRFQDLIFSCRLEWIDDDYFVYVTNHDHNAGLWIGTPVESVLERSKSTDVHAMISDIKAIKNSRVGIRNSLFASKEIYALLLHEVISLNKEGSLSFRR